MEATRIKQLSASMPKRSQFVGAASGQTTAKNAYHKSIPPQDFQIWKPNRATGKKQTAISKSQVSPLSTNRLQEVKQDFERKLHEAEYPMQCPSGF